MITWLRTSVPGVVFLRPLVVAGAVLSACLAWLEWLGWLPGSVHAVDGQELSTPAALSVSAVLCALALRRARRTPSEQWLWLGVMWSCALLSPCVLLISTPAAGADLGQPATAVIVVSVVVATYLVQHAGVHAWRQQASLHADSATTSSMTTAGTTNTSSTSSATSTNITSPAVSTLSSRQGRAVDRHEVLMGLAAVLVTVALLNAGFVFVPSTLLQDVPRWGAWAVLQVPLTVIAVCAVRAQALLVVAHARRALGDLRVWLMAASAVGTVLIGIGAVARILGDAAVSGLPHQNVLGVTAGALLMAPLPLLLLVIAAWLPPRIPRRGPASFDNAATLGAFAILAVAVAVLTAAAVGYAAASDVHTLAPAHLAPYGLTTAALSCAAALLGAIRLLLNLRHLAWSMTSQREAITDDLTGLLNRRGLLRRLDRACTDGGALGMALIDVDHFKAVNDGLGHAAGDELLRQITQRLLEVPRTFAYERVMARLGGDEFVVLVLPAPGDTPDDVRLDHTARARPWGVMLQQVFHAPFDLAGAQVHISASIGLTTLDPSASSLDERVPLRSSSTPRIAEADRRPGELLRRVDAAMYEAKADEQRGRAVIYDPVRHDDATHRLRTVEQLRHGLDAGELVLHYQPQLETGTGCTSGVEALVRWAHPTRGLLGPAAFLPLAEAHGLMTHLSDVVLEQAVAQLAAWRAQDSPAAIQAVRVSVNLSATSLLDAQLPARVAQLLHTHQVPAHQLVLEVTETVLLRDPERSTAVVQQLRELGVELSIDDFGTGYSSLTQLRTLAVQELKLDRAFTFGLDSDARAAHIVASTVALAHGLGMRVVAEGVEDEATLAHLTGFGCDLTQGYLHARPLPPEQLAQWLHERDGLPAIPPTGTAPAVMVPPSISMSGDLT